MNTLQKWQSCNAAWRCWLPSSDGLRTPWDHRFCGSDFYIVACHQATRVSTTQYCNNQNKQSVDNDFLLPAHWEAYPCRSLESDYGSWRPAGPSVPGTAATTSNVELSLEEVLRLFMGLSVSPSWAPGSCGSTAAAPGCTNRQGEKKKPLHMLWELLVLRGTAQGTSVLRAAAPVCSVRRWEQRGGRKRLSRPASVCVSVCTALLSRSTSEAMQRCGYVCWARAGRVSTVLGAGGHVWRPAVTVNALQSSPAASQATSREFRHFPFSSGGHCLAVINILYLPVAILEGRRGGTIKLLGRSFSINALSPFHCLVFYLGLRYECLSSQSSWS